jgi:integrase
MDMKRRKPKYPHVHEKHGAWYWVEPVERKWIRLCSIDEGEARLVARLAEEHRRRERPEGHGDMRPYIDQYVRENKGRHREAAWPKYGEYAGNGFRKADVADVRPNHVSQWLKVKYEDKLSMQRVMRSFLSGFFQWCIDKGLRDTNPCREVKLKKPKPRKTYITDEHLSAILLHMQTTTYERMGKTVTAKLPSGELMQCLIKLCYLCLQRSTEIRLLRWSADPKDRSCSWVDRAAGVIHFRPTKTEDSSGVVVDLKITPEIEAVLSRVEAITPFKGEYVFQSRSRRPYAANSVLSVFKDAKSRAGLAHVHYTVKDIRAKALTDGKRAGYDIKALQEAATHTNEQQTEDYIKLKNVPVAEVRLRLP